MIQINEVQSTSLGALWQSKVYFFHSRKRESDWILWYSNTNKCQFMMTQYMIHHCMDLNTQKPDVNNVSNAIWCFFVFDIVYLVLSMNQAWHIAEDHPVFFISIRHILSEHFATTWSSPYLEVPGVYGYVKIFMCFVSFHRNQYVDISFHARTTIRSSCEITPAGWVRQTQHIHGGRQNCEMNLT